MYWLPKLHKRPYRYIANSSSCTTRAATRENGIIAYAKTKAQISFAVTAKLISAFVFATRIVQFLFYLNPKFQASSSFLSLYRPVCVGPGRKPRRPVFSRRGSVYSSMSQTSPVFFFSICTCVHRVNQYCDLKRYK